MTQQIEADLWSEFQTELDKTKNFDVSKIELSKEDNEVLDTFFKKFLDPKENFPEGSRHSTIEKNFAIYIVKNKIDREQIEQAYKSKGFSIKSLISQIKGVINGTYGESPHVSIGELVNWCKQNRPDLVELFWTESLLFPLQNKEIKVLSDTELQNYVETQSSWVIKNLIKSKSINVLGGKRSTYKSWLCLGMAYCIANGISFLGKFDSTKGAVLYLDRENCFPELKFRSKLMKKGMNIEGGEVYFLSESYVKIDNLYDIKKLEEIILQRQIKVLIVDVYRRVIGFDENDTKEVSKLFVDLLKPLCERTGISILLIHHERKGEDSGDEMDMLRGSSDLVNYVDSVVQLKRKGETLTFSQNKSRGSKEIEPFQIKVESDQETYFKFIYKGELETTSTYISKVIVSWIINEKLKEFTYSQALNYCEGLGHKKNNIVNALTELVNKGIVTKQHSRSPYVVAKDLFLGEFNG